MFTNRKFWIAGLANAFYSAAMSLVLASMPFFVKYALGLSSGSSTFLFAAVLLIAIGCVAVWAWLVRKFTLMPVWRAALAFLAIAFIPLYFANSLVTGIIFSALVGFGFAGVITTMDLIGAKIMDEDTQKHGLRREGIISNAMGFMNRLNGLFTSCGLPAGLQDLPFRKRRQSRTSPGRSRPFPDDGRSAGADGDQFCLLVVHQFQEAG